MATPSEMYAAIPPVSKVWFTAAIGSSLLVRFGLLDMNMLLLSWPAILQKWQVGFVAGASRAPTAAAAACTDARPAAPRDERCAAGASSTAAGRVAAASTGSLTAAPACLPACLAPHALQLWRLAGAMFFFGEPSFGWIITMMML